MMSDNALMICSIQYLTTLKDLQTFAVDFHHNPLLPPPHLHHQKSHLIYVPTTVDAITYSTSALL